MITIISGTNRPNNFTIHLAHYVQQKLGGFGALCQVLDLQDLPHDFVFNAAYGKQSEVFESLSKKYIADADKFIFILPEYNGSYPGVVKAFIDCSPPKYFHHKKAALIGLSAGKAGNLRGMEHLTGVLHYLQVEVLSKKPKLSGFESLINTKRILTDENSIEQIDTQLRKFITF